MTQDRNTKPYAKLAATLVFLGMGIFTLERLGLGQMQGLHLPGWMITVLVVAPVVLILAGCAIFMVGRMRRL
jgi:hypothetical protein